MRLRLSKLSIRRQLWALFGLFLLTGATVLVIDEIAQYRSRQSLYALKDESLLGLRRIKSVSDSYGLDYVDTTFRARNYLITWNEGVAVVVVSVSVVVVVVKVTQVPHNFTSAPKMT